MSTWGIIIVVKSNWLIRLWRKSMTPKNHFETNWPLSMKCSRENCAFKKYFYYLIGKEGFYIHKMEVLYLLPRDVYVNSCRHKSLKEFPINFFSLFKATHWGPREANSSYFLQKASSGLQGSPPLTWFSLKLFQLKGFPLTWFFFTFQDDTLRSKGGQLQLFFAKSFIKLARESPTYTISTKAVPTYMIFFFFYFSRLHSPPFNLHPEKNLKGAL